MDDGALYQSSEGLQTDQPCEKGDTIKCSLRAVSSDPATQRERVEVTFSCNDVRVTSVLAEIPKGGFYGAVGMMSRNEKITLSPPVTTQKTSFQEVWDISTPHLVTHREEGICMYTGDTEQNQESVGTVRGKKAIDPLGDISQRSLSLLIVNQGEKDYIGMGVVDKLYPSNLLPGWEDASIGYHADTGDVFQSSGDGFATGHPCTEGDLMACVVHPVDNSTKQVKIVFTKNGHLAMEVTAWTPPGGFHFSFGMMSKFEMVQVILPEITVPFSVPKLEFEDVWEIKNANMEHRGSSVCHYVGNENVGTVRSKQPIDPFSSASSYEVKILDPGSKCYIALGVCSSCYSTDDLPGWEDLSVGFHADNGCILQKSGEESTRNPCSKGDVISCGVEPVDGSDKQMNVVFHKNGRLIGKTIFWKPGDGNVFAQIGCMSVGEVIQIASPLQVISRLKPDRVTTPSAPSQRPYMSVSSYDPYSPPGAELPEEKERSHTLPMQGAAGYSPLTNPLGLAQHDHMHQFFAHMYHHFQNAPPQVRGGTMPFMRPFGPAGPHHGAHGSPLPMPPLDFSMSYPPPVHPGVAPKQLATQQSEPAHMEYHKQSSSSTSSSEVPFSSQISTSSQLSVSSLETVPEESKVRQFSGPGKTSPKLDLHISASQSSLQEANVNEPIGDSPHFLAPSETAGPVKMSLGISAAGTELVSSGSASLLTAPSSERPLLQRSSSIVAEPNILTKEECKSFKILHNTNVNDNGVLEYVALHPDSPENSFCLFRLPLNEKLPYFQVELLELREDSNIAVGVVWDHYPVYHLPGLLEGSLAVHTKDNKLFDGKVSRPFDAEVAAGDVIGCRAALQFKSEVFAANGNYIQVEFFRNGLSLCADSIFLPPGGFFPAVGMTGVGTKVKVEQNIQLSPLSYFDTHPFPLNHANFAIPPHVPTGWKTLQRAKVEDDILFVVGQRCGKPSVVQHNVPFSSTSSYFQVQLHCDISTYSVLSVGAGPKATPDCSVCIPGESAECVGFLPLLGFIMTKGLISFTIPEVVSSELYVKNTTIGMGLEFQTDSSEVGTKSVDSPTLGSERVRLFFTINEQEVCSIITSLPKGGFYPTLAVESDYNSSSSLAKLEFPRQFPCTASLPHGFTRAPNSGFLATYDSFTLQDDSTRATAGSEHDVVRALQSARPLSPYRPYFEVRILSCGVASVVSCGVAPFNYPLDTHPGRKLGSIAFHSADGSLHHDGTSELIAPSLLYNGALVGCGARFPTNGGPNAEVFFTINRKLISSRVVAVPQMGLFPTVGMNSTGAMISVDYMAPNPFSDLVFKSTFGFMENFILEGWTVKLHSSSNPGALQLKEPLPICESHYFEVTCVSERNGRVMIGFSTSVACPLNFLKSLNFKACMIDIVSGKLMICHEYLKTRETCAVEDGRTFGIGIEPIPNSKQSLLFFTVNDYVISYAEVNIHEDIYPCVLMIDSTTKLKLDVCSVWPKSTPLGSAWARHSNLKLLNSQITHSSTQARKRLPVGFAQMCFPLTRRNPYFEVEICSRATNKAIAIGLASRTHPVNQWIGWCKGSIGYHSDDGRLFKESNFGHSFGPKAYTGDIVGCGAHFNHVCYSDVTNCHGKTKLEVYFTINGALVNTQKVTIPPGGFYPTICLESPSESVIFNRHQTFPPVSSLVNSEDWANAYSVHQISRSIMNCCRHKEINGGLPKAFCQAKLPFTSTKPYFDVEVTELAKGHIMVGASVRIAVGCTTPNTHSIVYSTSGHIIIRKGSQKSTREAVKSCVGDHVGCAVLFDEGRPNEFVVYVNNAKVVSCYLDEVLKEHELFPTVILTHPGVSVLPRLQLDLPVWDHSLLIGWLRSARVKIGGSVVEYICEPSKTTQVGVAQIRQNLGLDGVSYYEVQIINPGEKCTIAVGLAPADYPLNMQPGWCKNSIGYHGDDGKLFHASGSGVPFASGWKQHDVIGLGLRSSSGKSSPGDLIQVYFTRNGVEVGHTTACIPPSGFFPTIGMHSAGERVGVTLGKVSTSLCNDPTKLFWKSLSGVRCETQSSNHVLSYSRKGHVPKTPGILISLAVLAKPFSESMQYFEVELMNIDGIGIAVGVVPSDHPLDQAPGWSSGSIAYHSDNGMLYYASSKGKEFGPIAHSGDTIGCGVTFNPSNIKHCSVFFIYNGMEIGRQRVLCSPDDLYPAVALTDFNDRVLLRTMETFKPKLSQSSINFVGLMRINNCSYSEQIVKFKGSVSNSSPAVAQFAIPLAHEHNYYATNILECNDSILVGLAVKDYPLRYPPGSTSVSMAYDAMKGSIRAVYSIDNFHTLDAPTCSRGDTIGCGINFNSESKTEKPYVFYTKNNTLIQKIELPSDLMDDLYPVVSFLPHNKSSSLFMDWNCTTFVQSNEF